MAHKMNYTVENAYAHNQWRLITQLDMQFTVRENK